MGEQNLKDLITKFMESETVKDLHHYFSEKSMMEILGVDRDENSHSKFLAWLFEKQEALLLLMELLHTKNQDIHIIKEVSKIVTITEDFIVENGKKRRADILIKVYPSEEETPYYFVIENKVYSDEHTNQSTAYYNYYHRKFGERVFFVFLTLPQKLLRKNQKTTKPDCKEFIPITYQDLMDSVLNKMSKEKLVEEYIQCLGLSYWQEEKAMAYSNTLIEQLNDFWKENEEFIGLFYNPEESIHNNLIAIWEESALIIRTIVKALAGMPKDKFVGCEDHAHICTLNNIINGKDFTRYKIKEGDNVISEESDKNNLIFYLVQKYTEKKKIGKDESWFEILTKTFPETWRMKPNSKSGTLTNQIIIDQKRYEKEVKEKSKNDWELLDGKNVFVLQTLWDGKELMRKVIEKVKEIEELKDISITEIDDISRIWSKMKKYGQSS